MSGCKSAIEQVLRQEREHQKEGAAHRSLGVARSGNATELLSSLDFITIWQVY